MYSVVFDGDGNRGIEGGGGGSRGFDGINEGSWGKEGMGRTGSSSATEALQNGGGEGGDGGIAWTIAIAGRGGNAASFENETSRWGSGSIIWGKSSV